MIWYSTYLGPQIPIETTGNMQIVWALGVTYMYLRDFMYLSGTPEECT